MKRSPIALARCAAWLLVLLAGIADPATARAQNSASASSAVSAASAVEPVRWSVTEASSLLYNFNNRNSRAGNVSTEVDDNYGWWLNRLSTNAGWGSFQAQVRFDTAWFYTSRSPANVALDLVKAEHGGRLPSPYSASDADLFVRKYYETGTELSTRDVSWSYPVKYSLSYQRPNFDFTVGDSYAQFGRGLVLSLRKQDELASDTTLRGMVLRVQGSVEQTRFKFTALAGSPNPLRIDEASGRFLGTTPAVTDGFLKLTEAGMPHAIQNDFVSNPRPNFAPDRLVGGEISARRSGVALGVAAVHLSRSCAFAPAADGSVGNGTVGNGTAGNGTAGNGTAGNNAAACQSLGSDDSRNARQISNLSVNLEAANLPFDGVIYAELAKQLRTPFSDAAAPESSGHAFYVSLNINPKPLLLTGEFRHYRSFFPLAANIDPARAREFAPVQYSAPPTTESVWTDTEFEHFNTCVTGGKLRADGKVSANVSLFVWLGRYNTWGERGSDCQASDATLNRVWDVAQGVEGASADRSFRINTLVGARFDDTAQPFTPAVGADTTTFYRELYWRYDVNQKLTDSINLELRGWHRRRTQTLGGPGKPWFQGTTETGLGIGGDLLLGFGFEYDQNPAFPATYVNGLARYNLTSSSNLALFVGQRRGGMRCVSGVCRVFPPFEGARLDATFRF